MLHPFRHLIFIAFFCLLTSGLRADTWKFEPITADGKVKATRGADVFEISFPAENIVELHFMPGGKVGKPTPIMAGFKGTGPRVTSTGGQNFTSYTTSKMSVVADQMTLEIIINDSTGKTLCRLADWNPDRFILKHDPHKFSQNAGEISAGNQGNNGGPFIWTTSGYGLLWDCDRGNIDMTDTQVTIRPWGDTDMKRPDFDCYAIVGSPRDIFAGLADLTGHAPMFPKWSLGYMVSRWGVDEKEELANVDFFRSKGIPFDTYITDYDWFKYGTDDLGDFTWSDKFPDGPSGKFCADMAAKGAKWVGIRKPRISPHLPNKLVDDLQAKGWILPVPNGQDQSTKEFNFHDPAARAWWWSQELPLFKSGIAGYWNDEADYGGNFHFMEMVQTEYEGQRAASNQRVWTLNRNFLVGSQKFAYGLWSGDIPTGFPSMAAQRPRMMQAIDNGEAWWSMDTGGFYGDLPSPESYARWIQFATFVPIMRCHGSTPQKREPWNYGDQAEAVSKKFIELRYKLLPYLYSGAWQVTQHGLPFVRPMWIDYSDDPAVTSSMTDQWMVGDYLLVRPIVDQGASAAKVYLPKGTWVDYFTGKMEDGGKWIDRQVDAKSWDDMPLYVKRGAIIPTAPPMLYTGEKPLDPLAVEIYPDASATNFTYYDDDGQTYDYEKGAYAEVPMTSSPTANGFTFEIGAQKGSYVLPTKTGVLKFHLLDDKRKVQGVTVDGKALERIQPGVAFDAAEQGWNLGSDVSESTVLVKIPFAAQKVEVMLQ